MNKLLMIASLASSMFSVAHVHAQEMPELPKPQKEHEWLAQLAGEWTTESEMTMGPGGGSMKAAGTESTRLLGGFWSIAEYKGEVLGMSTHGVMTLGYDPEKKVYIGHWIDSLTSHRWLYEGTLDESGKLLTLTTHGPCPMSPSGEADFRETVELKSADHKVFTSSVELEEGQWTTIVTIHSHRKQ